MANRNNSIGGVHLEKGRGYRASLTVNGMRIRSQRVKTQREAKTILNQIRRALGANLSTSSVNMERLFLDGKISFTPVS